MIVNPRNKPPEGRALNLVASAVVLDAAAPEGEGEAPKLRRFSMTAYTGGAMQLAGWRYPVVVDLQGLSLGRQQRPILLDHTRDVDFVMGQTDSIAVLNQQLVVAGQVMGESPKAQRVIALNDRGFAWQASIGAKAEQVEFVAEGKSVTVNGQEFFGPLNVARRAMLGEVSFVVLGADDNTSAQIAAAAEQFHEEQSAMDVKYEQWLAAQGFAEDHLSESQAESLRALYAATEGQVEAQAPAPTKEGPAATASKEASQAVADLRAELAAESQRIAAIRKICGGKLPELEARAIGDGWDETRTELEALRGSRPRTPAIHTPDKTITTSVLEAACLRTGRLEAAESFCDERSWELADQRFRGGIGLQELLLEAAWANGYTGRNFRDSRAVLRYAFNPSLEAGYSAIDTGGILSNVANKFLLDGFFSVERTWRNICAVRNVSDFKTVTSYRLIGKDQYERVAPGGELKHGTLGEEKYENRADTYGLLLSIDRRDFINDDLDAITTVPRKLGRGSGLKINDVFWTVFLANSGFFTSGNKNYLTGADTALSIDGLTKSEVAFMDQTDGDGKPTGVMPAIVLVPTGLSALGTQLHKSLELRENTANAKYPVNNPHQGKFRVEVSRYLANAHYPGNSGKAWYLLAEATDLPVIEVAFLNGQESPTIETAEADFHQLGVQMRGYHDFGVALQDPRGGVKAKGEA